MQHIRSAVTLGRKVEGKVGVLRVTRKEELEEGIHVLASDGTCVNLGSVRAVRVADVDGLVEEDDVGVRVPAELVEGRVLALVGDPAWPELEHQTGHGAAARTAVQPESERSLVRVFS